MRALLKQYDEVVAALRVAPNARVISARLRTAAEARASLLVERGRAEQGYFDLVLTNGAVTWDHVILIV